MPAWVSPDAAALADAAAKLLQAGDFAGGLRACRVALAEPPGTPDLLHMGGIAAAQTGQLAPAARLLERAASSTTASAPAARHLAAVLNALGHRRDEARAHRLILR